MAQMFMAGNVGQSTQQPAGPQETAIPGWDGTQAGLANTLNALTAAVRQSTGQVAAPSNAAQPESGQNPSGGSKNRVGRFQEIGRTVKDVRVTNPDDDTQYVIVSRIQRLTLRDTVTGEIWEWFL